ncbi:hypothetical protein F5Y10DRAFT_285899 [Nemania abortiva]|nr:hypothetical protein F5Y10DRAFT_285899 [Nemania abortiva]
MAEVLGVAASAISVAGFAGQLAQGSTFLYNFFRGFKNAPEDIRELSRELQSLTLILTNINHSPHQLNSGLSQVLKDCEDVIIKLSKLVNDIQPAQGISKPRIWVKRFRATLKQPELEKHLQALERAKSTLLQCYANAASVVQARDGNIMKAIEKSLSNLAQDQTSHSSTTNSITSLIRQVNADTSALDATTTNIAVVTTKTYGLAEKLSNEMLNMQEVSARIEKATQDIIESQFASQPELLKVFSRSIKRTIKRSIRRHLKEALHSQTDQQIQGKRSDSISPESDEENNQDNNERMPNNNMQNRYSGIHHSDPFTDEWIRTLTNSKTTYLIMNSIFGILTIKSTIVLYCRRNGQNHGVDRKKESYTTIKYLPTPWISSKGVIARYNQWTRLNTCMHSDPLLSLRTVNIVPRNSKIFRACKRLDLDAVCRLFDEGLASPYDVDATGRNLLGYVAIGANFETLISSGNDITIIRDAANRLITLVKMLANLGLDAGEWEKDYQSPTMILCSTWLEDRPELDHKLEDVFPYAINTFLNRAKTDPFADQEAYVVIDRYGDYRGHPGAQPEFNIHPEALKHLIHQDEWPLPWSPTQINGLCDLRTLGDSVEDYVKFWVTCPADQVNVALGARLDLLRLLVKNNKALPDKLHYHEANEIIHRGGEVISLLTEHEYHDGTTPWVRHRFKKLILVRNCMLNILRLLLQLQPPIPTYENFINYVSEHAQRHNLRTLHIWHTALKEAGYGLPKEGNHAVVTGLDDQDTGSAHESSCGGEWETDYSSEAESNWETEEEWEEGPMLASARDINRRDEENTQQKRPTGCTCQGAERDYDEWYWSHVYSRIAWYGSTNSDGSQPPQEEGAINRLARAACSIASYVV